MTGTSYKSRVFLKKIFKNRGPIRKPLSPKGLRPWDYLVGYLPICPLQGFRSTERMLTAFQPKHRRPANLAKVSPFGFVRINEGYNLRVMTLQLCRIGSAICTILDKNRNESPLEVIENR
tara:strand:+ start:49 stop:408 length:360 start_codon:yes stop_codon:yes gene_type:complete